MDGGSNDETVVILEKYKGRLKLIQGFARATGDLMGWVNSDDILLPWALYFIAKAYISNPDGCLFGGNYIEEYGLTKERRRFCFF